MAHNVNLIIVMEPCTTQPRCVPETELVMHQIHVPVTVDTMEHNAKRTSVLEKCLIL